MGKQTRTKPKYKINDDGRIVALRSFGSVEAGDIGGIVDGEHNLSHNGMCWIGPRASVTGNASVRDNARVRGFAQVYDHAMIMGNASVTNNAKVYGDAIVCDKARVCGQARVHGNALVGEYAHVDDFAEMCDSAAIYGCTRVRSNAIVRGDVQLNDVSPALGCDAVISQEDHLFVVTYLTDWQLTFYRTRNGFRIQAGCQNFEASEMPRIARAHDEDIDKSPTKRAIWDALVAHATLLWCEKTPANDTASN